MKSILLAGLISCSAVGVIMPSTCFADAAVSTGIGTDGPEWPIGHGGGRGHGGWGRGGWDGNSRGGGSQTIWCDNRSTGYYACGNGWSCGAYQGNPHVGCVWGR